MVVVMVVMVVVMMVVVAVILPHPDNDLRMSWLSRKTYCRKQHART
jgi:hypothetical protein